MPARERFSRSFALPQQVVKLLIGIMTASNRIKNMRFRFNARTPLVLPLAFAMVLCSACQVDVWNGSTPLAVAVAAFNARPQEGDADTSVSAIVAAFLESYGSRDESPLTESEVISAIYSQIPILHETEEVNAIFRRIAETRRLPKGAYFDDMPAFHDGTAKVIWQIHLNVLTRDRGIYSMGIRGKKVPVAIRAERIDVAVNPSSHDPREERF